jgi:hypothetical protein
MKILAPETEILMALGFAVGTEICPEFVLSLRQSTSTNVGHQCSNLLN